MVVAAVATGEGVAAAATAEAGRSDPYQVCNNFLAKADLHIIPGTGTLPIVFLYRTGTGSNNQLMVPEVFGVD